MKKTIIAAIAFATIASSSAFAADGSGVITIEGKVTGTSCDVTVNGAAGGNATVKLPVVNVTELQSETLAKRTPFTISLTNCEATAGDSTAAGVTVNWTEGELDATKGTKGYLANTLPSGAKNVYLGVVNKGDSNLIVPGAANDYNHKTATIVTDGATVFSYEAGYITDTVSTVTAGEISSHITYSLSYN